VNYPSIRIEGAILSSDILDRIEDLPGQRPADFGLNPTDKVKDEIALAWADAQNFWSSFQRRLETIKGRSSAETVLPATTETRQQWMVPFLGLLGYKLEYQQRAEELNGKTYNISHRVTNRGNAPVHIIGYNELSGLDRKPERSRMSAHATVQEYLNFNEQLYGIVTNGCTLRLLRDSSRLVKLSYLEFDLDRIFTDGLFADFAVLYRLIHATRLPVNNDSSAESIIEQYHQDSLESGERIRDGLSKAVEGAIRNFGNGFLAHPDNDALRNDIATGEVMPGDFYKYLLRLIYRLLFLMVIEERDLVFPSTATNKQREIYRQYYSLDRLRRMSEKRYLADRKHHDIWLALTAAFRLFESGRTGEKLGILPLAGDLFQHNAIGQLAECTLNNEVLLGCLRLLSQYENPDNHQLIRVNYGALNVEEFGSVYEGLLELEPIFINEGSHVLFSFTHGEERAATGSHYTPDELVQPLIKHSLDYLITDKLKEADPEKALLSLRVADISCGSGHILLAAARRIATELAIVRTGEEQPSPSAFRAAIRDVISECIYGVDLNPLAVELCKVALWLESHNPGEPLHFLDHHIKCGNAIVGFTTREEVERGVPDEAFNSIPGDDYDIASNYRRQNKNERITREKGQLSFSHAAQYQLDKILAEWKNISKMPENTPVEIELKKSLYNSFTTRESGFINQVAAIPISQFYIQKTQDNSKTIITDMEFNQYWSGERVPQSQATGKALELSHSKRFFNWFIEFPDIIEKGGFDCILGNPPYLGGKKLSDTYGYSFCGYVRWQYFPVGLSDLVVFFLHRFIQLLKPSGYVSFITTNSIKDGAIREDGLKQIIAAGNQIVMAVRGIKWPGKANLVVSLLSISKGKFTRAKYIDGRVVSVINEMLEDSIDIGGSPILLNEQTGRGYMGSVLKGKGFILTHQDASRLISSSITNKDVVFQITNGDEINSDPTQSPSRSVICFHNW